VSLSVPITRSTNAADHVAGSDRAADGTTAADGWLAGGTNTGPAAQVLVAYVQCVPDPADLAP
jgi:hypothetical protein